MIAYVEKFFGNVFKDFFSPCFVFQFALPNDDDIPILFFEFGSSICVTLYIATDFVAPKLFIRFWKTEILAVFVAVPKTAVDKYDGVQTGKNEVGTTGKFAVVQTIPVTGGMKETTHKHFGLGVFASYCRHIPTAFFFSFNICHIFMGINLEK